jgi:hypothetical protein
LTRFVARTSADQLADRLRARLDNADRFGVPVCFGFMPAASLLSGSVNLRPDMPPKSSYSRRLSAPFDLRS